MCQAKDLMIPIPIRVQRGTLIIDVMSEMAEQRVTYAVVVEADDQLVGILSMTDIVDIMSVSKDDETLVTATVEQYMRKKRLAVVNLTDSCDDVVDELHQAHVHQLVVVDRMSAVGVITQLEVDKWFLQTHKKKR